MITSNHLSASVPNVLCLHPVPMDELPRMPAKAGLPFCIPIPSALTYSISLQKRFPLSFTSTSSSSLLDYSR